MAKAVTNSLTKKRRRVSDIVLKALIFISSGIVVALTLGMIIYIAVKGAEGMSLNFLTTPAFSYPYENYGVLGNIINTLYLVVITLIIATPVGVGAAIYLTEYAKQGRLTRIIEFTAETLAGIPSIIYGLFGSVFFYNIFKVNYSLLTGALTLSIMVLPTIIRTTQEAIKTVPMGYREGAVGLGAPKWHTIRTVVLPSCIDGILTSVILSIGRIVGESAALIFTAGIAAEAGINSLGDIFGKVMNQGGSLTVQLYQYAQRGGAEMKYAFSTALVLLVTVLIINICAKLVAYRIRKKRSV